MHWRGDDADDDGGDGDDYDDDDADDTDDSYDDDDDADDADDDDDADIDDDDDVYGHVGSRRLVLVQDFMDNLLLCPPTSLVTILTLLSLFVIQPFSVLQPKP